MTDTISTTGKRVRAPEPHSEEGHRAICLRLEEMEAENLELEAENLVRNPTPILDHLALRL